MSVQCKCGSCAINDDPDRLLCDRCWRDAEIERLQKALKSADGQNASLWKNLFDTEAEISRLKEERTLRPGDTGMREGLKIKRWREIVDLGILSVGREWNEEHCRCDVDTGWAPCYYCAEHAAILVGEQMLDKIERLQDELATANAEIERLRVLVGRRMPRQDESDRVWMAWALKLKAARAAGGDDGTVPSV